MYIDDRQAPASGARALLKLARKRWVAIGMSAVLFGGGAWWLADRGDGNPVVQELPSPIGAQGSAADGAGAQLAAAAQAALKPIDSVVEAVIRPGDTLDAVFRRLQLSVEDLAVVRSLPGVRQSLDILRPGDVVTLTHLNGELTSLKRRVSETETLNVQRDAGGQFAVQIVENELDVRVVPLHGTITSSLFRTVNDVGASDSVALQLAEVFRYDIDFAQELQPGDSFTLVLEKVWRDGEFLRDGDILAAEFVNAGRAYRAVRYTAPDGKTEYYTPEGKSLRKAFLRAPLQFSRISSGFGMRWHPVLNRMRAHKGVDYAAPIGTPIRAAGDGRVSFRGVKGGYGNTIVLQHSNGVETLYAHLHRFPKGVVVGKRVKQGDLIGYVGMSGLATGPHLHYEYRVNGVHRNPASIKTLPAEPISPKLRADFEAKTRPLLAQLQQATPPAPARVAAAR
ncbi:MAG: M23 family metallopeptidase [Steroidobacteraceae bacterium]|jgi:murein DD-endopeptidase MepM/ murein hydrolase activator NlpD|nr:M23 family metallopeptidase [Steroidobacteraceae bacterium]